MATYYLLMPGAVLRTGDILDNPPNVGQGRGAPPLFSVNTSGRVGQPLRVFGTDGRTSWWVRGARGTVIIDRASYELADPLAPPNVPVIYYLVDVNGGETMVTQTVRGFAAPAGHHLVTDLNGIVGASVFRFADEDQRSPAVRQETFAIPGRRSPVARWDGTQDGTASLEVATTGQQTSILRELLASGEPLIFLHNAHRCPLLGCDVPGAQVGFVSGADNRMSRRMDVAERRWNLAFTVVEDPLADLFAATSTVEMFDAFHAGLTVADFDAAYAGSRLSDLDQTVWA